MPKSDLPSLRKKKRYVIISVDSRTAVLLMESIALWMTEHGYEPHGETVEELLSELVRQAGDKRVNSGAK